jgi:hypothetical protein
MDIKHIKPTLKIDPHSFKTCSIMKGNEIKKVIFVIVGYTLLGLSEALHIFQVDTGGLPPNPTGVFCMFS